MYASAVCHSRHHIQHFQCVFFGLLFQLIEIRISGCKPRIPPGANNCSAFSSFRLSSLSKSPKLDCFVDLGFFLVDALDAVLALIVFILFAFENFPGTFRFEAFFFADAFRFEVFFGAEGFFSIGFDAAFGLVLRVALGRSIFCSGVFEMAFFDGFFRRVWNSRSNDKISHWLQWEPGKEV